MSPPFYPVPLPQSPASGFDFNLPFSSRVHADTIPWFHVDLRTNGSVRPSPAFCWKATEGPLNTLIGYLLSSRIGNVIELGFSYTDVRGRILLDQSGSMDSSTGDASPRKTPTLRWSSLESLLPGSYRRIEAYSRLRFSHFLDRPLLTYGKIWGRHVLLEAVVATHAWPPISRVLFHGCQNSRYTSCGELGYRHQRCGEFLVLNT